ncbi:hypothetical protein [Caenispirillum salinarum]|uniref:hypothetical protein n=1 Tax=Caenispirillum salinarum TaxID=859058 RepID=UPI00384E64E4
MFGQQVGHAHAVLGRVFQNSLAVDEDDRRRHQNSQDRHQSRYADNGARGEICDARLFAEWRRFNGMVLQSARIALVRQ